MLLYCLRIVISRFIILNLHCCLRATASDWLVELVHEKGAEANNGYTAHAYSRHGISSKLALLKHG